MNNNLRVDPNDTVKAGYAFLLGGFHPEATVTMKNANVQTDVTCSDGRSYTLTVPLAQNQSYTFPDSSTSSFPFLDVLFNDFALLGNWLPASQQNSPLVYQGSATASATGCRAGAGKKSYLFAFGIQDGSSGDPAGPGIVSTDTDDPLSVRFHCADDANGSGGHWSPAVTVNHNPPN
jgi:hypothetical protein